MSSDPIIPASALVRARKRTENMIRASKHAIALGRVEYAAEIKRARRDRPRTWGECKERGLGIERPCPFVTCAYHLAVDVDERNGSVAVNFPNRELSELPETCTLAVAERNPNGLPLEEVGRLINLTRERVRQLELRHLADLRAELALRRVEQF